MRHAPFPHAYHHNLGTLTATWGIPDPHRPSPASPSPSLPHPLPRHPVPSQVSDGSRGMAPSLLPLLSSHSLPTLPACLPWDGEMTRWWSLGDGGRGTGGRGKGDCLPFLPIVPSSLYLYIYYTINAMPPPLCMYVYMPSD